MTQRFLIAKYVPDIRRMEPRNVGVVVWSEQGVSARFAGETLNGRHQVLPPKHLEVRSRSSYQQWVKFWRYQLDQSRVRNRDGGWVDRHDPAFVDALCEKSKPQYLLVDAGVMLRAADDLEELVEQLFAELVAPPGVAEAGDDTTSEKQHVGGRQLKRMCGELFRNTGIKDRRDYWENYTIALRVNDVSQVFRFDYALYKSRPHAVFQRLTFNEPHKLLSTAFQFQNLQNFYDLDAEQCASLVHLTGEEKQSPELRNALDLLHSVGTVVNVAEPDLAANRLLELAM
jgi:hypothetical protein